MWKNRFMVMAPVEGEGSGAGAGSVSDEGATQVSETEGQEGGEAEGGDDDSGHATPPPGEPSKGGSTTPPEVKDPTKKAGSVTETPPAFTPNFKVKVTDKEFDVPERFRELIKDADSQKEVLEILEKAYGLDHHYKPKHEKLQNEFSTVMTEQKNFKAGLDNLATMVKDKSTFMQFMQFWGVDKKALYELVANEVQFDELPENQRNEILTQRQREADARKAKTDSEGYQQRWLQSETRNRHLIVDNAISRSDIAKVVSEFDTRVGQVGAFKQEVINRGIMHAQRTGKDLDPETAVREVMSLLGYHEEEAQTKAAQPKVVATVKQKNLPVIPAVAGAGSASPVKKVIKNVAELRALAKQTKNARR